MHGTSTSPAGVANQTTKDMVIKDPQGNTVLKETDVYTGSGYQQMGWTIQQFDVMGNLTAKVFSNGTQIQAQWSGSLKVSEVNTRGIETDFAYDALGREVQRTKKGVSGYGDYAMQGDMATAVAWDAADNKLSEITQALDLSQGVSRAIRRRQPPDCGNRYRGADDVPHLCQWRTD